MTLNCQVIACPKSKAGDPDKEWWVCKQHWALIPRIHKRLYRKAVAAYDADLSDNKAARCRRAHARMIIAALERDAGIA